MIRNVLALVALVIFGSLNTLAAESIDAAPTVVEAVSADVTPAAQKEEIATNVIGDDEENFTDDDEEKVSGEEHSFNLEEEEDDFD